MTVRPFPFERLERVPKDQVRALASLKEAFEDRVDAASVARALGELAGTEVQIAVKSLGLGAPKRRHSEVTLEAGAARVTVGVARDLALALLSRVLGRSFTLPRLDGELGSNLEGALAALLLEVGRRVTTDVFALASHAPLEAALRAEAIVLLEGKSYGAYLLAQSELRPTDALAPRARDVLASLGAMPIAVPLVVAVALCTREELAALAPGAAFLPGDNTFVDVRCVGRGVLASPTSERGQWVDFSPDGRVVLRGDSTDLGVESRESIDAMKEPSDSKHDTLTEVVIDTPVVVRVELGAVSLTAAEWAKLRPGDVLETGRRLSEPAVLRVGGRAIARGELVDVDGELGVRVRELLPSGSEE
jgi:type III secretion system YscQ/HrcQ family protein